MKGQRFMKGYSTGVENERLDIAVTFKVKLMRFDSGLIFQCK